MVDIAFIFFGQLREFNSGIESWKKNVIPELNGHNVNFFAHFWDDEYLKNLENFNNYHSPLILQTENQKTVEEMHQEFGIKNKMHFCMFSQSYSFYKAFQLLKIFEHNNNKKFDLYIKLRSDLIFLNKINFDLDGYSVYTKDISHWREPCDYIHDYILLTKNYSNIEAISNLPYNFDNILEKENELKYSGGLDNKNYCCEEILAKHILMNEIPVKFYNFNVDLARHHL